MIFDSWPKPSSNSSAGYSATLGSGANTRTIGRTTALTAGVAAAARPMLTPRITAIENPANRRNSVAAISCWKVLVSELLRQAHEHHAGRRQQRRRRIAERDDRLPQRDQERDRHDPEQNIGGDGAQVHAKLKGMSKPGSDHFTSLPRIFSNAASRPMPIAPMMMIMA